MEKHWHLTELIFSTSNGSAVRSREVLASSVEGAEERARELFSRQHPHRPIVKVNVSYTADVRPVDSIEGHHCTAESYEREIVKALEVAGVKPYEEYDVKAAALFLEEDQYVNAPNEFWDVVRRHKRS